MNSEKPPGWHVATGEDQHDDRLVLIDDDDDLDKEAAGRSLDEARANAAIQSSIDLGSDGAAIHVSDRTKRGEEANEFLPLWVEMIAARQQPDHSYHQHVKNLPDLPPGLAAWSSRVRVAPILRDVMFTMTPCCARQATRAFEGTPASAAADALLASLKEDYRALEAAFGPEHPTYLDGGIKRLLWAHGSFHCGLFEVPGSPGPAFELGDWRSNTELLGLRGLIVDDNPNDSVEVNIFARHEGAAELQRYKERLLNEALEMPSWERVQGSLILVGPFRIHRAAAMAAKLAYLPPAARCGGVPPAMVQCLATLQVRC